MMTDTLVKGYRSGPPGTPGTPGTSGTLILAAFTLPANGLTTATVTVTSGVINDGDSLFGMLQGVTVLLTRAAGVTTARRYLPGSATIAVPAGAAFTVLNPPLDVLPIAANATIPTSGFVDLPLLLPDQYTVSGQTQETTIKGVPCTLVKQATAQTWRCTPSRYPTSAVSLSAAADYFTVTGSFSLPTTLSLLELLISGLSFRDLGYGEDLFALVDQNLRKAVALTSDYKLEVQDLSLPNGLSLPSAIFTALTAAGVEITQSYYAGWDVLFLDVNNRLMWGIKEDGTVVSGSASSAAAAGNNVSASSTILATAEPVNGFSQIFATQAGVRRQLTTGGQDSTNPQALTDKVLYKRGETFYYKAANNTGREILAVSASPIAVWGDSYGAALMQNPPAGKNLAAQLGGRQVFFFATGGQTGAQIAARQGGKPAIATISGGVIPASGAVGVSMSANLLNPPGGGAGGPIFGTIQGAYGSLSKDASNVYTFTRTVAGSAINIASAPFIPDTFNNSLSVDNAELTTLILGFRNGVGDGAETDVSLTTKMLAGLLPLYPRAVILSQFTARSGTATAADGIRRAANNSLRDAFPDNYFDVRTQTILTSKVYIQANYPGVWTAQDDIDVANDDVPTCLFSGADTVHINAIGSEIYSLLTAQHILSKNW